MFTLLNKPNQSTILVEDELIYFFEEERQKSGYTGKVVISRKFLGLSKKGTHLVHRYSTKGMKLYIIREHEGNGSRCEAVKNCPEIEEMSEYFYCPEIGTSNHFRHIQAFKGEKWN